MKGTPFYFFGLVFLLSIPFWVLGILVSSQLLPALPVSAMMAICPGLAAAIIVFRRGGSAALRSLLYRVGDYQRMRLGAWFISLGTMPAVMVLSAVILMLTGNTLPPPEFDFVQTLALFCLFFLAAIGEELGWTAYATGPMVKIYGLIVAGLIIGVTTCIWHTIPLLQAERSWDWIAWWALGSVSRRMIIVWLYVRGGQSVFSASLFHAMSNVSWMLFPVMGSHYDPVTTALILIVLVPCLLGPTGNTRELA